MNAVGGGIGSEASLRTGCDSNRAALAPRTFRIVGVAQFPFDDEAQHTAVMTRTALRDACGEDRDEADMLMVASSGGAAAAVAAIRSARPDFAPGDQRADCGADADAGLHHLPPDLGGALHDHPALLSSC